jgi:hypothetical protein
MSRKLLKRGYIILISGIVLFAAGITLSAVYGNSIAESILRENIILSDISIDPSSSVNRTLHITNTEQPISIALQFESEVLRTQTQQASTIMIAEQVTNPRGFIVNKNQINSDQKNDGLFTTFDPDVEGEYTLTVSNLGSEPVKVVGTFGYLPIIANNNQVNLQLLNGVIAGGILFITGIITLVVGAVIAILDRKRNKRNLIPDRI